MVKKHKKPEQATPLLSLILAVISVLLLLWVAANVRPDAGTATTQAAASAAVSEDGEVILPEMDVMSKFDSYAGNAKSDALSNISYIPKVYTIPEDTVIAPTPSVSGFGESDDPAVIQTVIDSAANLLNGDTLMWTPETELFPGSAVKYYIDDTILVLCWKEVINGGVYSFAEVKVADGSQLRRAIADNTYGSSVQYYPSDMAKEANAIVAINGDFYTYRKQGITVYQRTVYRFEPSKVDSAFFTADGDMLFSYHGEMQSAEEAQQFVDDNDIVFGVAFGPILIDDGEIVCPDSYPLGEIDITYSRSAISQLGERHYLLTVLGEEGAYGRRAALKDFAQVLYDKGVRNAYTLDGGQTATIVFNGSVFNRVDWGAERTMSDIIYFATALPSEEVS